MKSKGFLILVFAAILLLLAACGDTEEKTAKEKENAKTEEISEDTNEEKDQPKEDVVEEEEEESEGVSFEVNNSTAPEDQGDLDVWFEGDVQIVNHKILAKGKTNLLPESRIYIKADSVEGVIIGGNGLGVVEDNGDFEIEARIPDEFKRGLLHINLSFETGNQTEEIMNHYADRITGNFAGVYYYSYKDQVLSKAAFSKTILFDGEEQSFEIEEPEWNIPDDLGDADVWIKPTIEKFEDYVVVHIESNLVEESFVRAITTIPNYLTTGFNGSSYANPDGSMIIYLKDPEKDERIKDLQKYEITLEMNPADANNGKQVTEAYGEAGEKLLGELVVEQGDGKAINQKITITVE